MGDSSVKARFSSAASRYESAAALQAQVASKLAERLPDPKGIHRILEIGGGTGILTRHLVEKYPQAQIEVIDISSAMNTQAQANIDAKQVNWICADYTTFTPQDSYDLICSSSTLHWLTPLDATFKRMRSQLNEQGSLAIALMLYHTFDELHTLRATLFPHKLVEQRLPHANEIQALLPTNGQFEVETIRTPIDDPAGFFKSIRDLGVTAGAVSRTRLSRSELNQLQAAFDAKTTTWEIGYVFSSPSAEKPQ